MGARAEVMSLIREVVNEVGRDHVAKPQYRVGKRAECIAAHVTLKLGGQEALMALRESTSVTYNLSVLEPLGVDYEASRPLWRGQYLQDRGFNWGEMLDKLEEMFPETIDKGVLNS